MILLINNGNLRINLKAREWCKLYYPDHFEGCPNYGNKPTCPPQAPLITEYFNLTKPLYLIYVTFDLASHTLRMQALHPAWSKRQCKCVLYWQPSINKELRWASEYFSNQHPGTIFTTCPEAMGVNVIETARRCGLPMELKPTKIVYKIAIAGEPA